MSSETNETTAQSANNDDKTYYSLSGNLTLISKGTKKNWIIHNLTSQNLNANVL